MATPNETQQNMYVPNPNLNMKQNISNNKQGLEATCNKQIELVFEQSEKDLMDILQRTKEGIETAQLTVKQIGCVKGSKLYIKKEGPAKELIRKNCKTFGGTLNDIECIKLANLSRNTYYKYKREIKNELTEE